MKCYKCGNEMILKDSNYQEWDDRYWKGYSCSCGNVEIEYLSGDEYRNNRYKSKKINNYSYMMICPNCRHNLSEDFQTESFYCNKCKSKFNYDELYKLKTGLNIDIVKRGVFDD